MKKIMDCLNKVRCRFLGGSTRWHCILLAQKLSGEKDGRGNVRVIPHPNCAINFKLSEVITNPTIRKPVIAKNRGKAMREAVCLVLREV